LNDVDYLKERNRIKIFQNAYTYLSVNQLKRDLSFKSFGVLEYSALFNVRGEEVANFQDIPNSMKEAFLVDDATLEKQGALVKWIGTFHEKLEDKLIKVKSIIEHFPLKQAKVIKLKQIKKRDELHESETEMDRDRQLKELRRRLKRRIDMLYAGKQVKHENVLPTLPNLPKPLATELGQHRRYFRDKNKEKARRYQPFR